MKPHHIVEDLHLTVFQFKEVEVDEESYPAWSLSLPPATTLTNGCTVMSLVRMKLDKNSFTDVDLKLFFFLFFFF